METTLTNPPTHADLAEALRERARAEWRTWSTLAALADDEEAAVRAGDSPSLIREAELSFIPHEIGQTAHWSDAQVSSRIAQARRVRDRTPSAWNAFREGRIDEARAREISFGIERLQHPASIDRLDRQVVGYAETHTTAELRRWLKVFVARVEADLLNERAEKSRADRGVDVVHGNDGMSSLILNHTSIAIAAVDKRLTKEAKALGADDPRTLDQRRADLAAAWLTTNESCEAALNADIAVTITADALAGATDMPAVAADGSWVTPVAWVLELAKRAGNNVFWHRMVLDPVTDDVLSHEYKGRYAPDILTKALGFRDGVCQASGCCRPASQCDMDHRIPHEADGPTAGWNLGPYCRRHHKLKGFGLIDAGPTTTSPPGHSRNDTLRSVGVPEISHLEDRIEWVLAA